MSTIHIFEENGDYNILPNDYVIIEIQERILLPQGIVGRFIPASNVIEKGLGITLGKIEYPFCHGGEKIRFGIKNYLNSPVKIEKGEKIAYLELFDLRGYKNDQYQLDNKDKMIYNNRKETT